MERREFLRLVGASTMGTQLSGLETIGAALAPATQSPREAAALEVRLTAAPGEVPILQGPPTRVWRYTAVVDRGPAQALQPVNGSYLGPILRVRRGQRLRVRFRNGLDEPSIVHWHGLDVPEASDGHPRLAVEGGQEYVYDFEVTNRAGTYWYHPHPHMRTAAQAYRGMAGLLIVTDPEEESLELPSGEGELVFVLQDRRFDARNQLVYADTAQTPGGPGPMRGMGPMMETMNGWLGDRVLVNGQPQPTVRAVRRTYRVRLLNGSNARIYKLAWSDGTPWVVIGGDGGLLERARRQSTVTLAPGQRLDALLDLSERSPGTELRLRSTAYPASAVGRVGMMGDTSPLPQGAIIDLVTVSVTSATGPGLRVPERLCTPPATWRPEPAAPVRPVPLTFMRMQWLMAGRTFEMTDVAPDETVDAGSTQIWELRNLANPMGMAMAHPIHVHGTQFRVLSRAGAEGNALLEGICDTPVNDTVLVLPGETVRIQLTFSRHAGLFLYHCHILEHEDMGMMRNFRITAAPAGG